MHRTKGEPHLNWQKNKNSMPKEEFFCYSKSTSDPAGIRKHQPKSAAHSANRSNIGNRTKLYNLHVLFLPGQGTSTFTKDLSYEKENSYLIIREIKTFI